jgi:hypothetical protein
MRLVRALALLAVIVAGASEARPAAAAAFDSAYRFESAFLTGLKPGDTGQFSVFFDNVGTTAWASGTFTQVNLAACLSDKVTCNVTSPLGAWNPGSWTSNTAYATQTKAVVAPGEFTAFSYLIKVPAGTAVGTYRFNGDLVLASTGAKLHPEGYYQDATVTSAGPQVMAPNDMQIQVASLDGGPTANDVRVFFNAPSGNPIIDYEVQRAVGDCPVPNASPFFTTIQTLHLVGGVFGAYNDLDRPGGVYCYQIRVKTELGGFVYSNQGRAAVFSAVQGQQPVSTSIVLTRDGGFPGILDAGDIFVITFSDAMALTSNARIRVVDADCGAPASPSSGPASCAAPNAQTISDINCGSTANCALSLDAKSLTVTINANPVDVAPGSQPGVKLPADVTESSGITSQGTGTAWNIAASSARVIGP